MSNLINLLSKTKLLLILLTGGLLLLILIPTFTQDKQPLPSSLPSPTAQRILPNFPAAQPQDFSGQSSLLPGNLAVTSNTEKVKVTLPENIALVKVIPDKVSVTLH